MTPLASVDRQIGDALSHVSSVLGVPVLIAAVIVLALCAVELGRWATEIARRARATQPLTALTARVVAHPADAVTLAAGAPSVYAESTLRSIGQALQRGDRDAVDHALDDYEHLVERRLDGLRVIVRAGPAIGLMGTLIPLAPGLRALGTGDVRLLTEDLRIAFAATVVGLLAGTIAFGLTLARTRRWNEDLAALERATDHVRAVAAAAAKARAAHEGAAIAAAERASRGAEVPA
ncbi:MAG: MotA/TolQ/ExbB proton channel family protein [Solirubrobacteraceae bacterium]|nr:MotA/TolQ/ExbB proton channel family protein [Patulibacter sp.]